MGELKTKLIEALEYDLGLDFHADLELPQYTQEVIDEMRKDFFTVWNNAYGDSSQQGIDIYNKWFLKWFGQEKQP
jgi:hypothetical protein